MQGIAEQCNDHGNCPALRTNRYKGKGMTARKLTADTLPSTVKAAAPIVMQAQSTLAEATRQTTLLATAFAAIGTRAPIAAAFSPMATFFTHSFAASLFTTSIHETPLAPFRMIIELFCHGEGSQGENEDNATNLHLLACQ